MRLSILAAAISLSIVGLSAAADVQAAIRKQTNIPAQGLGPALQTLATDHDFQLIYVSEEVNDLRTSGAVGEFTSEEALTHLLRGTPLTFRYLDERTITVFPAPPPTPGSKGPSRSASPAAATDRKNEGMKKSFWNRLRLAQADQGTPADPSMRGNADGAWQHPASTISLEEIVVTGSRLKVHDVQNAAPVAIFDRGKIDKLGVASVTELIRYMPQAPYTFADGHQLAGAQFAEMRGLGVDTTLVLINGRRTVPSAANVAANAFDLNTIPLAAIERVEVLSDSASAVYGADAVGGVINLVLKREIDRPVLDLSYGAAQGGADEYRASLSAGHSGERLRASLVLDYFERNALPGTERDRWANQDFRRFGGMDWRTLNTHPANITSRTSANLPGLPSRFASVPEGSSGVGLTPADLLPTAGEQRMGSFFSQYSAVSAAQRRSAAAFAELEIMPNMTAFAELMYVDRESNRALEPASLSNALVPATNPFNPFGVDVSVNYSFAGLGPREAVAEQELQRAVGGVRGALGDWDWEASILHSEEDSWSSTNNGVDPVRVAAALAAIDPAAALNVFQDGPGGSEALLASLVADSPSRLISGGEQISAFMRGPLFSLPAGEVQVVLGGERREEDIYFDSVVFLDHERTVDAVFAEARLPLVNAAFAWPAINELSVTIAGRQDRYSDFGDTFNPQYALRWAPLEDLLLSASYGTSFRAPAIFELFSPRREIFNRIVTDPRRNGEQASVTLISGGNPELDPVEGTSWSAGFVFTPAALDGLRIKGNYWAVKLDGRVEIFTQQLVLAHEAQFSERVIRRTPSPSDLVAGLPGPIDLIDISRVNFGRTETRGVDASVSHSLATSFGRVHAEASATWVHEYTAVEAPGTGPIDRVGVAHLAGSIPKWRAVGSLGWSRGGLGVSATTRYIANYEDRTIFGTDPGRDVDAQWLVDAQVSLDAAALLDSESWAGRLKITAGVVNLFDEEAPFAEIHALAGYDQSQGDLRQRFGYLRLSYTF